MKKTSLLFLLLAWNGFIPQGILAADRSGPIRRGRAPEGKPGVVGRGDGVAGLLLLARTSTRFPAASM